MNRLLQTLMLGGSSVAIIAGAAVPATAQDQLATEQVVVTGTSIRGVAPVGTNLITVDQKAIQQTAPVNMQELLNSVPGISTTGAPPQGTSINSFYAPQIHQLAGSISNSTLTVVDGLRLVGAGGDSLADPNVIPTAAIERVEVLAEGASSVYGSDAVSGVVNFIVRKSYDGLLLNVQAGEADHYSNATGNLLWGTSWATGSAMFAAGYDFQSRLPGYSRKFLTMGDYTPVGGNNYDEVFGCPTAAMAVTAPTSVSGTFLSSSSTTTVSSTAQSAKNCNITTYGDALPESTRRNGLLRVTQDFSDRLTSTVTMDWNSMNTNANNEPGVLSGATAYGPGYAATGFNTGQINPFFVAPAGAPGATKESVSWVDQLGNGANGQDFGRILSSEEAYYATLVTTYKLTEDWDVSFSDALGNNEYDTGSFNAFCSSCALLALNGTAQSSGSLTTSDVAGRSIVSLNLPLTTANALDVWDPVGSNKTNSLVAQSLYKGTTNGRTLNTFNQARLEADGSLFDLPAGPLKMAFGGEYVLYHLLTDSTNANGTGALTNGTQEMIFRSRRNVFSAFAEAHIPVIAADMGIPFVQQVDLAVSGRYDKYSDVGPTFNPKYGLDWTIAEGYKIRANYSTSFVAPPVGVLGDPSQGGEYSGGTSILQNGGSQAFNVPASVFPTVSQLPGCAAQVSAQGYCTLGNSALPGLSRQYGGALSGVKPQTGNGWSVGGDFAPTWLPGFVTNLTLFNQTYKGGVTAPNINQITTNAALYHLLTLCPNGCTQTQIDAFTRVPEGGTVGGTLPGTVYFFQNHDENNVLNLSIQGIDLNVGYDIDTDYGTFHIGDAMTEFLKFDQNTLGGPSFSELNTSGINSTFPSVGLQSRTSLGWTNEIIDVVGFINWTGSYHNAGNTTVNPLILDANGNYAGGGDHVLANVTFDLHASYDFPEGALGGDQVYLDIKNLFDTDPPFYNYPNHGDVLSNNGYNPFVSNPIGRLISLGFRAKL
jgi:iron complex outermembrane receptor protein